MSSMHFDKELNARAQKIMTSLFGEPHDHDGFKFLFHAEIHKNRHRIYPVTMASGQVNHVRAYQIGDVVELKNGRKHVRSLNGWRPMPPEAV